MKILRIITEINKYQLLLPTNNSEEIFSLTNFNGLSKKEIWTPLSYYIDNPLAKKADFYSLVNSAAFVCTKKASEIFSSFLNMSSELLPIYLEDGTELFIVNVIDCVNLLNKDECKFYYYEDGSKSNRIERYSFFNNRFHESSIFKIPETVNTEVLTYAGVKSTEDEFYYSYLKSGLEGLLFDEIYSDQY